MSQTPEFLEADVARQRAQLADTVTALQHKLDVKQQAQHKAADLKHRATTADGKPRPQVLAAAGGVVALVVLLAVWKKRGSRG